MIDPYVSLATGVVVCALHDLRTPSAMSNALDAADFLLRRVWDEESLWRSLLGKSLVQREVQRRVLAAMHPEIREALPARLKRLAA